MGSNGIGDIAASNRPNFPALTSIRGFAAWWVVLYHFRAELPTQEWRSLQVFASYGYLAVDLFFIMSGFVIALNYEKTVGSLSLSVVARFLGFRLARIYPLHIVILVAFLANPLAILMFSSLGLPGDRYDPTYYILSVLLVQNWGFSSLTAWNFPAWSISTEWASYLLFPLLAWFSNRFVRCSNHAAAALVCLVLLLYAFGHFNGGLGQNIPQAGLLRCVLGFATGMALHSAWALRTRQIIPGSVLFACGTLTLVLGVSAGLPDYTFAPAGFVALILGLIRSRGLFARVTDSSVLVYIGEVSYSTYLVHYLVKDWVKFLFVQDTAGAAALGAYLGLTAAASVCLYHLVELPGRSLGRSFVGRALSRLPSASPLRT